MIFANLVIVNLRSWVIENPIPIALRENKLHKCVNLRENYRSPSQRKLG